VIARASTLFLPTLREDPADAEAVSHKLLVRGAFVRQVSAGVWTFLPLGWRVHQKVVQIIREEIDAIGGQEMLMPVLTPFELWQQSGRDYIQEIFRLKDRNGREFVLPMTHEETVTFHARELQSYRQLPQILYHFSVKERDEPRPRGGMLFLEGGKLRFNVIQHGLLDELLRSKLPVAERRALLVFHQGVQTASLRPGRIHGELIARGVKTGERLTRADILPRVGEYSGHLPGDLRVHKRRREAFQRAHGLFGDTHVSHGRLGQGDRRGALSSLLLRGFSARAKADGAECQQPSDYQAMVHVRDPFTSRLDAPRRGKMPWSRTSMIFS